MLKNFCLGRKVKKLAKLRPGWNGMFELFLFFFAEESVGKNKKASSDSRKWRPNKLKNNRISSLRYIL